MGGNHFVKIPSSNLKSLAVKMAHSAPCKFLIYTPNLQHISISDSTSSYQFVKIPSKLVKASIDLPEEKNYRELTSVSKIAQGIGSVRCLCLNNSTKMFYYLNSEDDGVPVFYNLTHFDTTLNHPSKWTDLLSLRCFPKLESLEVTIRNQLSMHEDDSVLDSLDAPLLSKLKRVKIVYLGGSGYELKLLEFIISKASALEQLVVGVRSLARRKEVRQRVEYRFCEALFKFPRSSPACVIEYSGEFISTSSNGFKDGPLTRQIQGSAESAV